MKKAYWKPIKLTFSISMAVFVIITACALFIYPAVTLVRLLNDPTLEATGVSSRLPDWFESVSALHVEWAQKYLDSNRALEIHHEEVAETEWPMFGSVFYLVTAQELHDRGLVAVNEGIISEAIALSAEIVASPETATWVRTKWGDDYLERENLFYRMLLIMGLASYQSMTDDPAYEDRLVEQTHTLAAEIEAARLHLVDDYPYKCYPNDILWAVAAIQRSGSLRNENYQLLVNKFMGVFDGPDLIVRGLPAYQISAQHGYIIQDPRGCGNSGILQFAAELDPEIAEAWYSVHEEDFWKDNGWLSGFTEVEAGSRDHVADVDSGPVLWEYGSVASAFGIGAANSVGRLDHSVPLTLEAVACSWPTPFGFLVPQLMGMLAVDSRSLGEVALFFTMTRPNQGSTLVSFDGDVPGIVWVMLFVYLGVGTLFITMEIRAIRRFLRK